MAYADFTLQAIEANFGVAARPAPLFTGARPAAVPGWLQDLLARTLQLPLVSEKARSELIVMPVLLACRELSYDTIAIFSGPRLDVSPEQGLLGECDFLGPHPARPRGAVAIGHCRGSQGERCGGRPRAVCGADDRCPPLQ